jgi:hypothetical protein
MKVQDIPGRCIASSEAISPFAPVQCLSSRYQNAAGSYPQVLFLKFVQRKTSKKVYVIETHTQRHKSCCLDVVDEVGGKCGYLVMGTGKP